ncbi:glycoside hydrolase family 26 protein [Rhodotorula toruloides]|uniref:Glycoside hydrolase family 26 protein n=1 Tax=Rhodotorula toruloides TaxID=5286 RepID=A0A511KKT5_RHOTO|nr:glycoside hydrolase family 26 protein [Rhodotorula toruloides]
MPSSRDPRRTASPPSTVLSFLILALSAVLPSLGAPTDPLPLRPLSGLPSNGLSSSGIALGFLPFWSLEGPTEICSALGSCAAVWGDYWNASPSSYNFEQASYHIDEVERVVKGDVKGVYAPAVLFSGRMNEWTEEMSQSLAQTVRGINRRGVKVWLRWCFEMNGGWMSYGLQPSDYVNTWRSVTNAIRAATNETYMLWSPNLWTGNVDDPVQGYTPYWPGENFVDIVGLSFYSFGPQKSINKPPSSSLFRDSFSPFYNLFSPSSSNPLKLTQSYPLIISETSAPYYYLIPPSSRFYTQAGDTDLRAPYPNLSTYEPALAHPPYEKSDDELYSKASWLVQMVGNATAQRFPNLKAVTWFNYLKKGNGTAEVIADFRFVGGNKTVEGWLRQNLGNQTAYEQGYTGGGRRLEATGAFAGAVVVVLVAVLVCAV